MLNIDVLRRLSVELHIFLALSEWRCSLAIYLALSTSGSIVVVAAIVTISLWNVLPHSPSKTSAASPYIIGVTAEFRVVPRCIVLLFISS